MDHNNPPDIGLFQLNALTAICVIGQIQLASRHPANNGPSQQLAEKFARQLQERVVEHCPDYADILHKGWDPEYDC